MNNDPAISRNGQKNGEAKRSLLDRIGQVLNAEPRDRDDLVRILKEAQRNRLFDVDALSMIEGVLQVSEMQVRDIMIPRAQMVVVQRDAALQEILPVVSQSSHSRFPVVGENRDEVVGILLAKDLLPFFIESDEPQQQKFSIRDIMRKAVFVPESKRLNMLLKEFKSGRNHMAIVRDEYGGVAGLVTIEDVLEQIVGEIVDEHDIDEEGFILKHHDHEYTVKALTPLEEFNAYFDAHFDESEFDTLGGVLMKSFGHVPERGETVQIDRFLFRVLKSDSRRIHLLHLDIVE
ncbi:MAG: CBS domain-containing protein [Gammaproteobacteria bacterium]|nr:MAG: CBS domain-containing protein [Gammaproteobacteria bacterium]